MASIRRTFLLFFYFLRFISWLIPWSWVRGPRGYIQSPREASAYLGSAALDEQTDEYLSVSNDDLEYLTREEAEQIIERFKEIPQSYNRLLFWTGIPREWVQEWADDHGMLTLTSAMGYLMDRTDQRCLKRLKELEEWSKYVRGASGIFARYACGRGIIRVLTLPPSLAEFIRPESTYRNIEEPVLKGTSGCCCAVQINTVHLLTTLEQLEYQTWPENHIPERLRSTDAGCFNFRLPRWTRKAVKATKSLRSNFVSFAAFPTPELANANIVLGGSVRKTCEPQSAKQPKGVKQSVSNVNAQGSLQTQNQRPQSKIQQPQNQQSSSKTLKPQSQQPKSQQPSSKEQSQSSQVQRHSQSQQQQSKKQLPQGKKQQPQNQQLQSKKQQSQNQQSSSTTQQSQSQHLQNKKQQSQSQQPQPQSKKQLSRSTKSRPLSSKQPQQSEQPQSNKELKIKVRI